MWGESVSDGGFDHLWKISHFELVLFGSDVVYRIEGRQWYFILCYNVASIANLTHPVHGHAGFGFLCSLYGLMYMPAIHAFATEFGQQGRMKVDDAVRIGSDKERGNKEQKTGQDNEIDMMLMQEG